MGATGDAAIDAVGEAVWSGWAVAGGAGGEVAVNAGGAVGEAAWSGWAIAGGAEGEIAVDPGGAVGEAAWSGWAVAGDLEDEIAVDPGGVGALIWGGEETSAEPFGATDCVFSLVLQ
jgi:hypothetical protein